MTISSKDLSAPAGLTGVARDEAIRRELAAKAKALEIENEKMREQIKKLQKEKVSKKKNM